MIFSSRLKPRSSRSRRFSAAAPPVCSVAWMLASTQTAGFVSCGPVFVSVTVHSQMFRRSFVFPMLDTSMRSG